MSGNLLTRPAAGAAIFVEADRKTVMVRRRIKHHCTWEEWQSPARRAAKIAEAWRLFEMSIRSEGERFVLPSPVVVYRDPVTGAALYADIRLPHEPGPRLITADGYPVVGAVLHGLFREETTYAHWAEGPLPYFGNHEAMAAPDPLADRHLQRIRHQNRHLRAKIDAAIAPSFDPIALDAGHPEYVDFRVRGICERQDLRTIQSKQTQEATRLIVADGTVEIRDHNPADLTE